MSKTIKINDIDVTSLFTRNGYVVSYKSIKGTNAGTMLDGSYQDDELALKAVIKLPVMPLNGDQVKQLLGLIYSKTYVDLYYFDPVEGDYKTIKAMREASEQKYRGFGSDGKEYWTGGALTLTEK